MKRIQWSELVVERKGLYAWSTPDAGRDLEVTVDHMLIAVDAAVNGCPLTAPAETH